MILAGGGAFRHHRIGPTLSNGVKELLLIICANKVNKRLEELDLDRSGYALAT